MRIPWWLSPWREARKLRLQAEDYEERIDSLCETARQDIVTIANLEDQVRLLTTPKTAVAQTGAPEFMLIGVDRGPGQGKRLYASRDLDGVYWGMTEMHDPPPRWHAEANLSDMLITDKPSYGEGLQHLGTIYAARDGQDTRYWADGGSTTAHTGQGAVRAAGGRAAIEMGKDTDDG